MGLQDELRAARANTERWVQARRKELEHRADVLESRGRDVYNGAIATGRQVLARTPAELRALGLTAVQGRIPEVVVQAVTRRARAAVVKPPRPQAARPPAVGQAPSGYSSTRRQLQAGVSGAADEFTFGLADRATAAGEALFDGGLAGFRDRYDAGMAEKRAADAYDAEHFGLARNAGRVAGMGASVAIMGAPALGRAVLTRVVPRGAELAAALAKAPRLTGGFDKQGMATLASVGGGAAGVIGQGVTDVATGKLSSLGDYAGAALGGAAEGLTAAKFGPLRAGMAGGAATSAAQDYLKTGAVSPERMIESAHTGAAFAGATGAAGTVGAAALPRKLKGELGEAMSKAKAFARGEKPTKGKRVDVKGGYSVPDLKLDNGQYVEAKMGPTADLSVRQKQLRHEQPGNFILDAWKFSDVGRATSTIGSAFAAPLTEQERSPWRR